jgi:TIR domain
MTIPNNVAQWLQDAGYEHHCFISWPHVKSRDVKDCAINVKLMIEQFLAISVHSPKVFIDEDGIPGGAEWEETLRRVLCRSVTMVAICAPIYYDSSHKWCGLEWAAMDMLSTIRLAGEGVKAVIPLIIRIREDEPLPEAVSSLQYFDFSSIMTMGRRYYTTQEYRKNIQKIVNRIDEIALTLANRQAQAVCDTFQIPTESAFAGYQVRRQPAPFRS